MAGVRSSKTVGSTTYKYDTLSGKVMRQSWGSNVIDFIYDENNQPFAMRYNGTTYYYVLNVQGDVIGLLNANGAIAAKYTYDPWGKVTVQSSNGTTNTSSAFIGNINPLRYRGYYYDTETGLYYLQSRYYDPAIGRFINADTYTTTDADGLLSTNMFAYCENNPVNRSDPNGEIYHVIAGAIIGAVVNCGVSMITHLATGEPYSAKDAITDALAGAASGALAATALGAVGQVIGNAAISGASKALELRNEPMSINKAISIGKSVLSGAICGAIGGKGLTNSTRVMKQISIINSNAHCAFRPSAFNSIKNSATRISKDIFDCLAGYTKGSFVSNALSQFSKVME